MGSHGESLGNMGSKGCLGNAYFAKCESVSSRVREFVSDFVEY